MLKKIANRAKSLKLRSISPTLSYLLILILAIFFAGISMFILQKYRMVEKSKAATSFVFTAAGDYGLNDRATSVLTGIASSGSSFNMALGDFSYSSTTAETVWCDYVKSNVGNTFPFELLSGNHEDNGPDGDINNFIQCLPNQIPGIVGDYGKQYYFDYQGLARFIQISPNLTIDGENYQYTIGTPRYSWLLSAIDDARAGGIKWIVVSMHEVCLSMGVKSCEIGTDLLNLLVDKKVDLVLQGHEHNYQRSKQLSPNSSCTSITINSYNSSCVSDDGLDGNYIKGSGTVFVINGTGGIGNLDINTSDSEAPYFANFMGANSNLSYGYLKFNVSDTTVQASFVPTIGAFSDSFTISESQISPTPTPTPLPTTELIQNGSFENTGSSWLSPWTWNLRAPAVASISQENLDVISGSYSARVNVTAASTDWYVQLIQGNLSLASNSAHTISFWAKADVARNIRIAVQQNYSPYGIYFQQTLAVSPTWKKYIASFTPQVNEPNALFVFNLGQTTGNVLIDDASITKPVSEAPTPTPTPTIELTPTPTPTPSPTPIPTPTPTPIQLTTILTTIADTHVSSSSPSSNYGKSSNMYVDGSPILISYYKFNLSTLAGKTITSVKLKVKIASDQYAGSPGAQNVNLVTDDSWTETGMIYNNRPSLSTQLGSLQNSVSNTWYEIGLSPSLIQPEAGFTLSLGVNSTHSDGIKLRARETADKPQLIITYQ